LRLSTAKPIFDRQVAKVCPILTMLSQAICDHQNMVMNPEFEDEVGLKRNGPSSGVQAEAVIPSDA
jgi:hypothetical protein